MHLFDIDVEGGQHFKESATFTPGDEICVLDTEFGRLGLCICFDIRFPELARIMALDGAWAVICPASFNMTTGPAHWEILFRCRAVDNQIYMLGAPRLGTSRASTSRTPTRSWCRPGARSWPGLARVRRSSTPSSSRSGWRAVRRQLPLMSARRPDMYTLGRA